MFNVQTRRVGYARLTPPVRPADRLSAEDKRAADLALAAAVLATFERDMLAYVAARTFALESWTTVDTTGPDRVSETELEREWLGE